MKNRFLSGKSKEEEVMVVEEEEMTTPLLLEKSREEAVLEGYLDREALLAKIAELEDQLHNYECQSASPAIDKDPLLEAEENLKQEWNKLAEDKEKLRIQRKEFEERVLLFRKLLKLYNLNNIILKECLASLVKIKDYFFCYIANTSCNACSTSMNRLVQPYTDELELSICKVSAALESIYRRLSYVDRREWERGRIAMLCRGNSSSS